MFIDKHAVYSELTLFFPRYFIPIVFEQLTGPWQHSKHWRRVVSEFICPSLR